MIKDCNINSCDGIIELSLCDIDAENVEDYFVDEYEEVETGAVTISNELRSANERYICDEQLSSISNSPILQPSITDKELEKEDETIPAINIIVDRTMGREIALLKEKSFKIWVNC